MSDGRREAGRGDASPRDSEGVPKGGLFSIRGVEWKIAWRHLRRSDPHERPAWVDVSMLGGVYLTLVGLGFLMYSAAGVEMEPGGQLFSSGALTASQRWFGVFGALGIFAGGMWLIVALFARFFNLLSTIISTSVLVGCMALVVVLSLMSGLEADFREKILDQRAHLLVSSKDGNRFADYLAVSDAIRAAEGVAGASPFVEGEVMAKSGMNRQGAVLRGVLPDRVKEVSTLSEIVERGSFDTLSDPKAVEAEDPLAVSADGTPWRLRHLEGERPTEVEPLQPPRTMAIVLPLVGFLIALLYALRRLSWRRWLPPTVLLLAVAGIIAGFAPKAPPRLAATLEQGLGGGEGSASSGMLERLKPRPLDDVAGANPPRDGDASDSKSAPSAPSAPSAKAGDARDEDGPAPRDVSVHAVDLDHSLDAPLGPGAGAIARSKERAWPKGIDAPPGGILRGEDLEASRPPKRDGGETARAAASKRESEADQILEGDGDGWEDPLAELGLDPRDDPDLGFGAPPGGSDPEQGSGELDGDAGEVPGGDNDGGGDGGAGWEDPLEELGIDAAAPSDSGASAPVPSTGGTGSAGSNSRRSKGDGIPDAVLVGDEMAKELAVRVGSRVQLITPIGRMTPAGRVPGILATRVGGIFYSGNYEYDRKNVYAPLHVVQAFLRTGDRVSGIEIKLENVDQLAAGEAAVQAALESAGRAGELQVETWQDLNQNLFSAMLLEKIAMSIGLLFVVLVASFGILASNLMSVLEKAQEIAILKAMGSSDLQVQRIFVAQGLCVGLVGATCGLLVGLAVCVGLDRFGFPFDDNVYYIQQLPVVVQPLEVLVIGIAALGIIAGSSVYPARVAARMRPVDGLRETEK